jgi:hypothetical protein
MYLRLLTILLIVGVGPQSVQSQESPVGEGDILLTEVMYAPEGTDSDREYVEVYNTTGEAVNLNGWTLLGAPVGGGESEEDAIDEDVVVGSGEFVVLCENADTEANGGLDCAFDYVNSINHTNTADYVGLQNPEGDLIDRVTYDEEAGWPDATGASIEFVGAVDEDNSQPDGWEAATARVGDFADRSGPNWGSPNANAPDGALPVELVGFQVRAHDGGAELRWSTATETGNAGFEIQRRRLGAQTWTREAFLAGHGTTADATHYRHQVTPLDPGTHRFRLRQVDTDGTSRIVAEGRVQIAPKGDVRVHGPNPVQSGTPVPVTLRPGAEGPVEVTLFDALGRQLRTARSTTRGTGLVRMTVSTEGLAAGTYFLEVQGAGVTAVKQLAIVR